MWSRVGRFLKRAGRRVGRVVQPTLVERVVFDAPLDNLDSVNMLEAFARSGRESGVETVVNDVVVTNEDVEALRRVLDEYKVRVTVKGERVVLPPSLHHLLPVPAPAPAGSVAWPENMAVHDQAVAALKDLMNLSNSPARTGQIWGTLTDIGLVMPPHASVSAVVEHEGEHILLTLSNTSDGIAVRLDHYMPQDPKRVNDPANSEVFPLPPPHIEAAPFQLPPLD